MSRIPTQSSLVNSELLFFITIQYTIKLLGQDDDQVSNNEDETPDKKSLRLTGTTLGQSTTPKSDLLMEGDGIIVISWYGKTNLLDDRDTFFTEVVSDTPPIYSTEPLKEGVGLSARTATEDFLPVARLIFLCMSFAWIMSVLMIPLTSH